MRLGIRGSFAFTGFEDLNVTGGKMSRGGATVPKFLFSSRAVPGAIRCPPIFHAGRYDIPMLPSTGMSIY